jgi:GNAT superfamily N-acetyltransferase
MIAYAKKNLHDNGKLKIAVPDNDRVFVRAVMAQGFRPTMHIDHFADMDIDAIPPVTLPDGFSFVSMADDWDWHKYNRVMYRGFDHGSQQPYDKETIDMRKQMLSSPMIILDIVLAIKAPDGNYAAHCGMWYRAGEDSCGLEPLVTDPDYRKMGLGKAVVHEGALRCGKLGAKRLIGALNQPFYCKIGFYPTHTFTYWEMV